MIRRRVLGVFQLATGASTFSPQIAPARPGLGAQIALLLLQGAIQGGT